MASLTLQTQTHQMMNVAYHRWWNDWYDRGYTQQEYNQAMHMGRQMASHRPGEYDPATRRRIQHDLDEYHKFVQYMRPGPAHRSKL